MAQGRMLRKEICESDSFSALNDSNAQLLCCLLTPWWDDHGKMIGDEQWIKGSIVRKLPQFTVDEIGRCLKLINDQTDVQWWQDAKGNKWLFWGKFNTYQNISQEKKTRDIYPSPKIPKNPQKSPRKSSHKIREDKRREVEVEVEVEVEDKRRTAASPALKAAFVKVHKDGLNIYALLTKLKAESRIGAEVPEEVLLRVCDGYAANRAGIKDPWPWFCKVVVAEWQAWNAKQHEKESKERSRTARDPVAPAIGQILAGIGRIEKGGK